MKRRRGAWPGRTNIVERFLAQARRQKYKRGVIVGGAYRARTWIPACAGMTDAYFGEGVGVGSQDEFLKWEPGMVL